MKTRWIALAALGALAAFPAIAQEKPAAPPKKEKKVWTNEDLESLRDKVYFSSFGPGAPGTASGSATDVSTVAEAPTGAAQPGEGQETPEQRMRKRIAAAREELAKVEAELRSMRSATTSGRTTGQGIDFTKTDAGLNTEARIIQLEQRRAALRQQIEALEDEARRSGLAPGAIR
jgi:hypothetical protein